MVQDKEEQYIVLARKYRPQVFEDLLGQDALVQTLKNAIENNRLHHAYILTGIRGVGKTTTARLIARALNCTGLDGKSGPTIHPCGACENCQAIASGRHIDVLELDAASRTGVDDIRELLASVQYKPTNARYKIYIIDEVHMLSKGAFNALLKTLEEPPAHVKFIFATTEIRKVPVTILSRCQRFDLQRLTIETLLELFTKILKAENIETDPEALEMVAKAADGSARDGLSMLDQAIVLGGGKIKLETVVQMIGLADRNKTLALFENLLEGNVQKVLENVHDQYHHGADPVAVLKDLIDITHMLTKAKIVPSTLKETMMGENERVLSEKLASSTSIAVLSKIWQMMVKGLGEIQIAPYINDALDMVLVRIAYSAELPTPLQLLEEVKKKSVELTPITPQQSAPVQKTPAFSDAPVVRPVSKESVQEGVKFEKIEDFTAYLENHKKLILLYALKNDVCIEQFENGRMAISLKQTAAPDLVGNIKKALKDATNVSWVVETRFNEVGETLADIEKAQKDEDTKQISQYPLVRAVLDEFKGAKFDTLLRVDTSAKSVNTDEQEQINNFEEED
ncbi:MAG: DNA polymerase III subunit gamma/tau [Alphaproteobacteria bacterium]|nr:DNA polymerase III subunit gamma/tau [Alphaproteobacteria bacterium]